MLDLAIVDQADLVLLLRLDETTKYQKKGSKSRQRSQRYPLLPLLEEPYNRTKLHNFNIYAEGLGQSYADSQVVGSVSVNPNDSWLFLSVFLWCSWPL